MGIGNRKGYIYPHHKVVYPLFPRRGESYIPILGDYDPSKFEEGEIVRFKRVPALGTHGHASHIGKIRKQRGLAKEYRAK